LLLVEIFDQSSIVSSEYRRFDVVVIVVCGNVKLISHEQIYLVCGLLVQIEGCFFHLLFVAGRPKIALFWPFYC